MTSIARDEPWLRVVATAPAAAYPADRGLADHAEAALADELAGAGNQVETWHSVEVLSDAEQARRTAHRGVPPLKDAAAFAELLDVKRQRIYQLLAQRRAGSATTSRCRWSRATGWRARPHTSPAPAAPDPGRPPGVFDE